MTDQLPDRLSLDPRSPYFDQDVLSRGVGIRFNGQEKTNVEEYCVSEGWIRVAAGRSRDRFGNPMTIKLKGQVEPYVDAPPEPEGEAGAGHPGQGPDDDGRQVQELGQRHRDVAGARRQVHDHVVQVAPLHVGKELADRAVELAPDLADGYSARGEVLRENDLREPMRREFVAVSRAHIVFVSPLDEAP